MDSFGERLRGRIDERGPLCVGIDPSADVLSAWSRSDSVEGLEFVARATLDAVSSVVAAVKVQVGFFERFASSGLQVLERVLRDAAAADVLVIADAKRGDVVTTNEGYARAWLGEGSPLAADAVTVSPYLGLDSLEPFFRLAVATGRGVFVLASTSNPEGRSFQLARTGDDDTVEASVLRRVSDLNRRAGPGLGPFGAVVGATRERPHFTLADLSGPYLVPGVGVQGASAADVGRLFSGCPRGSVLASVSRAVANAGPEPRALRDAAQRWRDQLNDAL